uniref:Uncharacterized protein n=1 Tax=Anguilla anguilla TaxID=7936 RepID=A0A0E9X325_ANGAN
MQTSTGFQKHTQTHLHQGATLLPFSVSSLKMCCVCWCSCKSTHGRNKNLCYWFHFWSRVLFTIKVEYIHAEREKLEQNSISVNNTLGNTKEQRNHKVIHLKSFTWNSKPPHWPIILYGSS